MKTTILLLFITIVSIGVKAQKTIGEKLAQQQLDAYNKHDIEAFLIPYDDSVAVYNFPNQLQYVGKDKMRKDYADFFANNKDLHCTLKKRIVIGNTVIDEESVLFDKKSKPFHAVAIYTIKNNKIVAVHFITK